MQRSLGIVVAVLVLSACTDYDDVTRGVCGNGLLEAGEDCDSGDASCVRCAVVCRVALDCPATGDYACGVDGFCHAPGGELAQPTAPVTFQATDLRITDVDHDGRGDVIGVSRTSLVVRYGDPAGSLAAGDSFVTPAQSGPASFGDLDGDGTLDVTLSTVDGLVTYSSQFGTLAPVDVEAPLLDGATGEVIDLFAIESFGPLQIFAFGAVDGNVVMFVFDFLAPAEQAFAAPCLARLGAIPRASFDLARVDSYRASPDGALAKTVVVSFTTTAGTACVMSISGSTAGGYTLADVTPAGIDALQNKPILADLETDADPCPGLVNSDGGALRWWDGRMSGGRCVLDAAGPRGAALPVLPGAPPGAVAIGRIPIKPAIPFVAADAIAMSTGIYGHVPGLGMSLLYQSSRLLSHVASGDLDGDGDIDAVVTAATEDDLDILYRYPEGLELLRYDTASQVTSVTVADFDGNGIGDFAYTESAVNHERLMIAYGTADRHLPPLQVAAFGGVSTITPIELPDSTDNLSVSDDLLVVQAVGATTPTLTLLHGSPQRTMLAFLDPRDQQGQVGSIMRGSVVGQFTGDAHPDLLVFAAPKPDAQALGMRAYRVAGSAIGLDPSERPGTVVDGLADCQQNPGSGACIQDIVYLAWPRATGTDVVIAVDRRATSPRALRIDPGQPAMALDALVADLPAGAVVQSLHATDLDGDGANELVASFASRSGALTGSVRICEVTADGVTVRCEDVAPAIALATATPNPTCIDAAPGRIGARGLVVLCRDGSAAELFRVTRERGALTAISLAQSSGLRALRVADVTGDGVDDVVAVQGDVGSALVVFTQCTTRDLGTCHASASAEGGGP